MQKRSEQENGLEIEFVCRKEIPNSLALFTETSVLLKPQFRFLFIIFWFHYPFLEMLLQEYCHLNREMINDTDPESV